MDGAESVKKNNAGGHGGSDVGTMETGERASWSDEVPAFWLEYVLAKEAC